MCTSQMTDMELYQQGQNHLCTEPCVPFGSVAYFPQPNIHTILPASRTPVTFDNRHLPFSHENALFYGISQYNTFQQQQPARYLNLGASMNPCGSRVFPLPINQGSHDQIVGVPTDDYGRNNQFVNGVRSPFKRKNAEGVPGSFQYSNTSAGSSSAIAPLNTRPIQPGVTLMDATFFPPASSGTIEPDSIVTRNSNTFIRANYPGQALQTASSPWSQASAVSYLQGSSCVNDRCTEAGTMGAQGYQETASNISSTTFLPLPPIYQWHPNFHHLPQPMHGVRGQNINFVSQVATPSHGVSTNSTSNTSMHPFQDGIEVGPRYVGPVLQTGLRMYRPHQRALFPEATVRHHDLPHLRFLPADEVAMLEISGYYEVENSIDHNRNMRLDVDHMSYEELLALGEQIGYVATGLSEEAISRSMKTRTYNSPTTPMNLEDAPCEDQETDFCVICQTDYEKQEKIGTLDCGHECHADCVKRWLLIKNTCPICKSSALTEG